MSSKMQKPKLVLKMNKKLGQPYHPETNLVFRSADDRVVVGRLEEGEFVSLDETCVSLCEENGFKYDETLLATEEEVQAEEQPEEEPEEQPEEEPDAQEEEPEEEEKVPPKKVVAPAKPVKGQPAPAPSKPVPSATAPAPASAPAPCKQVPAPAPVVSATAVSASLSDEMVLRVIAQYANTQTDSRVRELENRVEQLSRTVEKLMDSLRRSF